MSDLAQQARALRKNAVWRKVFEDRNTEIHEAWAVCEDPAKREQLWQELHALIHLAEQIDDTIAKLAKES